ncbi:MAG: carboxypeptidase-like regulatory domain-containing protein [Gelidibacter sp.]
MVGNKKHIVPFFMIFGVHFLMGQTVDLKGQITANYEVEGIHILNNASRTFTISNSKGEFSIPVKLNDTLVFSGVSYEFKKMVVSQSMIQSKVLTIYLSEKVTALDEVIVGKILTGDLSSDLANSGVKRDIDFYDLGIKGYQGKPKTQSERRLYTAGDFKPIHLLALLGGTLPVDPILNAISGRTKLLKHRVHLENQDKCIDKTKSNLSEILFSAHPLEEHYRNEFFHFCTDDSQFDALCLVNDDFETLEFLKEKLVSFKMNLQTSAQD